MNRETYLKELRKYLKRLPKDDYENAMEYFTEYFDDAGNDEEAIRELGSPREAASDLLAALLNQKTGDASSSTFSDASAAGAEDSAQAILCRKQRKSLHLFPSCSLPAWPSARLRSQLRWRWQHLFS